MSKVSRQLRVARNKNWAAGDFGLASRQRNARLWKLIGERMTDEHISVLGVTPEECERVSRALVRGPASDEWQWALGMHARMLRLQKGEAE